MTQEKYIEKLSNLLLKAATHGKNSQPCERYYVLLAKWQQIQAEKRSENQQSYKSDMSNFNYAREQAFVKGQAEKRVTSATHERWKNRIKKDINNRFNF